MNSHYTYLIILFAAFAIPFIFSFDKKVAFYKQWKSVLMAMILPAIFYIFWDILFTINGFWNFNDTFILGLKFWSLPIEEILFFFIVPYCCLFLYQCIKIYFPNFKNKKTATIILNIFSIFLFIIALLNYKLIYTFTTFVLAAFFIAINFYNNKFNATYFLITYIITLIPFLIVNGLLTYLPIVLYNKNYNLGVYFFTIPIEDFVYGFLLIMMNIVIFEKING